MRIAIIRRAYTLKRGGAERYCVNISRQLQALGHDVTIIGESIDPDLENEVNFIAVPVSHSSQWAINRTFAANSGKEADRHNFDIVYGLSRCFGINVYRLTDRLHTHWSKTYYKYGIQRFAQTRLNPRHRTILWLERMMCTRPETKRIIVQSSLDKSLVQEYFNTPEEKLRVIHNGVDITTFHPGDGHDRAVVRDELGVGEDPLLLFAASKFEGKGLSTIIRAMARSSHDKAQLVVIGQGKRTQYEKLATSLNIAGRVRFIGHESNIQRFYRAGDLFVLPTVYEPFPNVNLEAMACGCPVITSATAGGVDVIDEGRNGYAIPNPRAVDELTDRLDHHLALGTNDRDDMSKHCWETAQNLTLSNHAKRVESVFKEVVAL